MQKHPLESLGERYINEKNIAPATLKTYKIVFKHYIAYLKENQIEYAKTSDVIDFREMKRTLGNSSHWIYIQISALKGIYRYLKQNQKRLNLPKEYAYNIMDPIKNERINPAIKKPILTLEQAKHLILHTKETRKYIWHYRDHAIIYLMITTGLSSVEIIHAQRKDYKCVDGQRLLYVKKKGRGDDKEFVKIAPGIEDSINAYLKKRKDDNPYLFISHRNIATYKYLSRTFFIDMFRRVLNDCGLKDSGITPHCLRHTAATMNLLRGGSIEATRQLMRHTKIQSTLVYVDHIKQMQDDSVHQIESFILKEETMMSYDDFISELEKYINTK